jgi:hypothetical protein
VRAWFDRIWSEIQNALADVTRYGEARAEEWMPKIGSKLAAAKQELGDRVAMLVALLQENLLKSAQRFTRPCWRYCPQAFRCKPLPRLSGN